MKAIVLACVKKINLIPTIMTTWGKDFDVDFLADFTNDRYNIKSYDAPKTRTGIWQRYFYYLSEEPIQDDWYVFADDDTYINYKQLSKILDGLDKNDNICVCREGILTEDYKDSSGKFTGFRVSTMKNDSLPLNYPGGGAGFVISPATMKLLSEFIKHNSIQTAPSAEYGDVTMGFWLRRVGAKIIDTPGMWWTTPQELHHSKEDIKKSISYHYLSSSQMFEIHEICHQ